MSTERSSSSSGLSIDPDLLAILACPKCRAPLAQVPAGLRCTGPDCRLTYPIRGGIPVLLIDEAFDSGNDD